MDLAITVLWILLANGNVVTREFPNLESCLETQRILTFEAQLRGDRRFDRMLCISEAAPAAR